MKDFIQKGDHQSLINYQAQGQAFQLAIPTPEHYMPLIYTLALKADQEEIQLFNDKLVGGSLTMTSLKIGAWYENYKPHQIQQPNKTKCWFLFW